MLSFEMVSVLLTAVPTQFLPNLATVAAVIGTDFITHNDEALLV